MTDEDLILSWYSDDDSQPIQATFSFRTDQESLKEMLDGYKYKLILSDIDQWLRARLKYHKLPRSMDIGYENIRKLIRTTHEEYGLVFDS